MRDLILGLALGLLPMAAAAADCPKSHSSADLMGALDTAESAYAKLEVDGFKAGTDQARALLPCISEPLIKPHIARLHRFEGLRGFVDRDPSITVPAFAAARSIEPGYSFPEALVPANNPVRDEYKLADLSTGTFQTVAQPKSGSLRINGDISTDRPLGWPAVVQLVDDSGAVTQTAYVHPSDPLPSYDAGELPLPKSGGPNLPLLGGAGAAAIGAVVFAALGAGAKGRYNDAFDDPTATIDDVDGLRGSANTMTTLGIAFGVGAAGLGVGAALAGTR